MSIELWVNATNGGHIVDLGGPEQIDDNNILIQAGTTSFSAQIYYGNQINGTFPPATSFSSVGAANVMNNWTHVVVTFQQIQPNVVSTSIRPHMLVSTSTAS